MKTSKGDYDPFRSSSTPFRYAILIPLVVEGSLFGRNTYALHRLQLGLISPLISSHRIRVLVVHLLLGLTLELCSPLRTLFYVPGQRSGQCEISESQPPFDSIMAPLLFALNLFDFLARLVSPQIDYRDPVSDALSMKPPPILGRKVPVMLGVMSECSDARKCEAVFDEVLEQVGNITSITLGFIGT